MSACAHYRSGGLALASGPAAFAVAGNFVAIGGHCSVMAALTLTDVCPASKPDKNAIALKNIIDAWKGNSLEAARTAAFDIGMLVAGCMLAYDKAKDNVRRALEVRLVDDKWRSTVNEFFECGRSSLVTTTELHARFCSPVAANDNIKDDTIDAETLLGMDFEPLEYVIPGYVVEGLTVLGGKLTGMKVQNVRVLLLRKMVASGDVMQPRVWFYTPPAYAKPEPS